MTETKTQAATQSETLAAGRVITVVTTRGEKVKLNFAGTEWFELKKILEQGGKDVDGKNFSGYNLSNMKCVEGINKSTLEHPKATVPNNNFNLFLMPYKSKSGATERAVINATIKEFIAKDGDKAKTFFSEGGKNYTQLPSAILAAKIEAYVPGTKGKKKSAAKSEAVEATANVADVIASVKDAKEDQLFEQLQGLTTDEKLDVIIKLLIDVKNATPVVSNAAPAETEEQKKAREDEEAAVEAKRVEDERLENEQKEEEKRKADAKKAKEEADKQETSELLGEMDDLMGGFSDVKR